MLNSVEHCFDSSDTEASVAAACSSFGGIAEVGVGSDTENGITCANASYIQSEHETANFQFEVLILNDTIEVRKNLYYHDYNDQYNEDCRINFPFGGYSASYCSYIIINQN